MRPPKNNWPTTTYGRNTLFFAQLLSEMVSDVSGEGFRAYSLDSIARLSEAVEVSRDIDRNRIPRAALDPVLEELTWSFSKEAAIQNILGEDLGIYQKLLNIKGVSDLTRLLDYLYRRCEKEYKGKLENFILDQLRHDRKIPLRQATGFYCSHLINIGYEKSFIAHVVHQHFFTQDIRISGPRKVKSLFKRFSGERHRYVVYSKCHSDIARFARSFGFKVLEADADIPTRLRDLAPAYFSLGESNAYLAHEHREADEVGAAVQAQSLLQGLKAMMFIIPNQLSTEWSSDLFVATHGAKGGRVISYGTPTLGRVPRLSNKRALTSILGYSRGIFQKFDASSIERLVSSLETTAVARSSSNLETQLISLWSGVEVLLSPPEGNEARITHYVRLIVPAICLRYIRRQFVIAHEEMTVSYRRRFSKIVSKIDDAPDQYSAFAVLLTLQQYKGLRDELCALISGNPLGLHRLWMLHRDYSTFGSIRSTLDAHERRVRWQIQRIYRARNNLVHAGKKPRYLDSIIVNLEEYYRAAFGTIVGKGKRSGQHSNVDQVVSDIHFEYYVHKEWLAGCRSDAAVTESALMRLMKMR